jgi:hypothetical protein
MRIDKLLTLLNDVNFQAFPKFEGSRIGNLDLARAEILKLAEAPELAATLEPILQSKIFETDRDSFLLSDSDQLSSKFYRLQILILGLREALQFHAATSSPESVVIKIPDPNDFADALKSAEQFHSAINQVIANEKINGSIKLVGWEIGSFWIYLALGSPAAVALIGSIAWSAAVVRKKILEGSILKKQVEAMEIKNEALDAVREGVDKQIDLLLKAEAKAIYDRYFGTTDDPEQLQRLQYGIKTFSELLAKGAEVHPSLQAPESVANLFPDVKKLETITSTIAQIADKAAGQ